MEAMIVNMGTLFGKPVSYRIPQFQRPYAWKLNDQWVPLWDDCRNIAERVLALEPGQKMRPHFMGAIVLQRQSNNSSEVEKRLVVDGQQRLTTLQLLIRAMQEAFANLDNEEGKTRLSDLTTNARSYWGGNEENLTKILQSNMNDQRTFQSTIRDGDRDNTSYNSGIRGAYWYFRDAVTNWLDEEPESRIERMNALEETLTKHMETAAIDLNEDEQPHIIFETLNARGEPLKQSDLVKNTTMYEAGITDNPSKAQELWGMFDNEWWRMDTSEGRISRIHLDRFLNYWMVVLRKREVTADRVAASYREYISPKGSETRRPITEVAADLRTCLRSLK